MIFPLLPPLTVSPFFLATTIIAVAAIVVYEMLRWIVGRIIKTFSTPEADLPSDAELQTLNEGFGRGNPPVVATRDTRFQSAVSDISPGDVVVISEPKPPSFIIRAQEQFPEAGIEDNDDAQIATYRVVEWRLCQLEDRLEHLEAARKPTKKGRKR